MEPTVSLGAILITSCIDADKYCDISVMDISGELLTTDMVVRGRLVELMAQVNPKIYRKYVRVENGQKVLYVQLHKFLYGKLWAELLF